MQYLAFTVTDLFTSSLVGMALLGVWGLFLYTVGQAIVSCFRAPVPAPPNFMYVATAVAGIVLSVASGMLGDPSPTPGSGASTSPVTSAPSPPPTGTAPVVLEPKQRIALRNLYTTTYLIAGFFCLILFMSNTPSTHDLVKQVGLTTLGFMISLATRLAGT